MMVSYKQYGSRPDCPFRSSLVKTFIVFLPHSSLYDCTNLLVRTRHTRVVDSHVFLNRICILPLELLSLLKRGGIENYLKYLQLSTRCHFVWTKNKNGAFQTKCLSMIIHCNSLKTSMNLVFYLSVYEYVTRWVSLDTKFTRQCLTRFS